METLGALQAAPSDGGRGRGRAGGDRSGPRTELSITVLVRAN